MKFNPKKAEEIVNLVRGGAGVDRAARIAGLHPETVRRWRREGERAKGTTRKGKFARAIEHAKAELIGGCEQTIFHNAIKRRDSADAKWVLTKLAPDTYGDKSKIEIQVREEVADDLLDRLRSGLDSETYARVLRVLAGQGEATPLGAH